MHFMKWHFSFVLFFFFPVCVLFAEPLLLQDGQEEYPLAPYLQILEDPSGKLTLQEVISPEFAQQFVTNDQEIPNFGFTPSAYWVRFAVRNLSQEKNWLLEFGHPHTNAVDFYFPKAGGGFERVQTGLDVPFSQRPFRHRHFLFPLPDLPQKPLVFYLRAETTGDMILPMKIWSIQTFFEQNPDEDRTFGIYYGVMLVMVFYNLFLFISTRYISYLFYVFYIFSFIFFQMVSNGLAYEYLWPDFPVWNNRSWSFFAGLTLFWAIVFTQNFLHTARYTPFFHKMFYGILVLSGVSMAFVFVPVSLFTVQFSTLMSIPAVIVAVTAAALCWKRGYQPARYYLLGWSSLMLGAVAVTLKAFGLVPSTFLTEYGLQVGSALEVMLLSLGLADRLNMLEQQKLESQQKIIEQETEYRELVENLNIGVLRFQHDQAGGIVKINPAALQIFGYDKSEITTLYSGVIYQNPEDRKALLQTLHAQGELKNWEIAAKHKAGHPIWVSVNATTHRDKEGRIQWVDGIVEDITRRKEADEKIRRLNSTFEKFVPQQFLNRIASEGIDHIEVGKAQMESLSILFADIRSFTEFAESASPQELLDFLNTYLTQMNQPIHDCYGFIDKFIGDGIMALFDRPTHPTDSFRSSVAMTKAVKAFNAERAKAHLPPISIGIAIHSGNAIIGTIGTKDRMDSTVLGDTVNLAARMESLTSYYNAQIIISSDTYETIKDDSLLCRELDFIMVKGKKIPKTIFEVFNGDEEAILEKKQQILAPYSQGLAHYRTRNWQEAIGWFEQCLNTYPEDVVSQMYIERCHQFQKKPPNAGWNGEIQMRAKRL